MKKHWVLTIVSILLGSIISFTLIFLFIDFAFSFLGKSTLLPHVTLFAIIIVLIVIYVALLQRIPDEIRAKVKKKNIVTAILSPIVLAVVLSLGYQLLEQIQDNIREKNRVYHPDIIKIKENLPELSKEYEIYLRDSQFRTEKADGKDIYIYLNHSGDESLNTFIKEEVDYFIDWLPSNEKGYIVVFVEHPYSFEVKITKSKEIVSCNIPYGVGGAQPDNACERLGIIGEEL